MKETVFKAATLNKAVEWCQLNGGWKAVISWPVSGRDFCGINNCLYGEIMTGKEKEILQDTDRNRKQTVLVG